MPNPIFIVSPHLDDAVFSCALMLAGHPESVVCTVLAGTPEAPLRRRWDLDSGFADSSAALRARLREDDEALRLLAASPLRLPFLDGQYGDPPPVSRIAAALADELKRHPGLPLLIPMGLWHSDHVVISDACCEMLGLLERAECLIYEDALYRTIPGAIQQRRNQLASRGFDLTPFASGDLEPLRRAGAEAIKRRSVCAYRSQLRALGDPYPDDLAEPERYWQLTKRQLTKRTRIRHVR